MAFSSNTICCCNLLLNIPSPNPTFTSTNSSSFLFPSHRGRLPVLKNKYLNQISCTTTQRKEEESSWRRRSQQCVLGMMACMIINSSNNLSVAIAAAAAAAADSSSTTTTTTTTTTTIHASAAKVEVANGGAVNKKKWSDKQRVCQPWRLNSLETIVPENLPRPSAHRRSESISSTTSSSTAPSPPLLNSRLVLLNSNVVVNDCFSM